jgi:hypothetical protein
VLVLRGVVGAVDVGGHDPAELDGDWQRLAAVLRLKEYALLYRAADTLREPTLFEFLEVQPLAGVSHVSISREELTR